jgi:hypothetical protein
VKKQLFKLTEHPVIATLIATSILGISYGAIFAKLEEWIGNIIEWFIIAYFFIISVLTFKVEIWKILLFFIVLMGSLFLYALWREKNTNNITTTSDENKILKIIEKQYNKKTLNMLEIARILRTDDMAVLEQIIENLHINKKLLERYDNFYDGTTYALSKVGRDYVIANRGKLN